MRTLRRTPLEDVVSDAWLRVDPRSRRAFFVTLVVSVFAFGFEMTNYTIDHDDLWQLFIEDDILGHYIGRFALGWLHLYLQGAHVMPFLQVAEGIVVMALYGVLVARFWGLERTLDIALVACILCVFPYTAQVNSYNAVIVPYAIAHLLAAWAVKLSTRIDARRLAAAAALYVAAFLIYQSVIANAATIFVVWLLAAVVFKPSADRRLAPEAAKATISALIPVVAGGIVYFAIVRLAGVEMGSYQGANEVFGLEEKGMVLGGIPLALTGTRAFFFWPEPYFPEYLKRLQLVLLAGAGVVCFVRPPGWGRKALALALLAGSLFAPRLLQVIHPAGTFHNLTLTAYAVCVAGFVMLLARGANMLVRNVSSVAAGLLIGGYLIQSNWISTVNYLNTLAQYSTMTQILSRVRAVPSEHWDGKRVVFVGRLKMQSTYPFQRATGVATPYIDEQLGGYLTQLLRADLLVLPSDKVPGAAKYAQIHPAWPSAESVGVVDGAAVVVLSRDGPAEPGEGGGPPPGPR